MCEPRSKLKISVGDHNDRMSRFLGYIETSGSFPKIQSNYAYQYYRGHFWQFIRTALRIRLDQKKNEDDDSRDS